MRHLTADRRAAAVSAIGFAFCPYVFSHTSHIQLMMTAGLPFSMLAFHRLADRPTAGRGAVLGLAMAIAGALLRVLRRVPDSDGRVTPSLSSRRDERCGPHPRFWAAVAMAALVAIVLVLPAFLPYLSLQGDLGFSRTLDDARRFSARWSGYLASSSYAHIWMLRFLPPWGSEVVFPGFVVTTLGIAGAWLARRTRRGELTLIYGGFARARILVVVRSGGRPVHACSTSVVPVFDLLRVPGRFGVVVVFGLAVLAGLAVSSLLSDAGIRTRSLPSCAL